MLYKPNGVITSVRDPQRRRDLREWLNRLKKTGRFFYAGRLDFHSEGLLLLTTDGELTYRLTHPRYGVSKRYRVKVRGMPKAVELERLRTGILLGDGWTAPAAVRRVNASDKKTWIEIEIREGKNRQVRRMFEALGYLVEKLTRTGYGPLDLGQLRPGEIRELSAAEVRSLHQAVAWDCDRSESKTKNEPWGEHHRPSSKRRLNR
jgi:23S rRNA pseudouridine2605 synthase